MTDITPVVSNILQESNRADPIPDLYHYSFEKLDTFLQEAYRLARHFMRRISKSPIEFSIERPHFIPHFLPARDPPTLPLDRASSPPPRLHFSKCLYPNLPHRHATRRNRLVYLPPPPRPGCQYPRTEHDRVCPHRDRNHIPPT